MSKTFGPPLWFLKPIFHCSVLGLGPVSPNLWALPLSDVGAEGLSFVALPLPIFGAGGWAFMALPLPVFGAGRWAFVVALPPPAFVAGVWAFVRARARYDPQPAHSNPKCKT